MGNKDWYILALSKNGEMVFAPIARYALTNPETPVGRILVGK
jgi:hypothetical protein